MALAAMGNEAINPHGGTERRRADQTRHLFRCHACDFHLQLSNRPGLALRRFVRQFEPYDGDASRCVAERFQLDDTTGEDELIRTAQAAAGVATCAASVASAGLGASIFSTERAFSSFIIGEGVVTAAFILMVR